MHLRKRDCLESVIWCLEHCLCKVVIDGQSGGVDRKSRNGCAAFSARLGAIVGGVVVVLVREDGFFRRGDDIVALRINTLIR